MIRRLPEFRHWTIELRLFDNRITSM